MSHRYGRYLVFSVKNEDKATMDCLVGHSNDFYEASILMKNKGNLMYDQITATFFDPAYVYSQQIASEALNIMKHHIGNRA